VLALPGAALGCERRRGPTSGNPENRREPGPQVRGCSAGDRPNHRSRCSASPVSAGHDVLQRHLHTPVLAVSGPDSPGHRGTWAILTHASDRGSRLTPSGETANASRGSLDHAADVRRGHVDPSPRGGRPSGFLLRTRAKLMA
jgi:hypothetical protein